MAVNLIYTQLVRDNSDAVGMFAYALYKQQKMAFFERIDTQHGRLPTNDELESFHMTSTLPPSIHGYREQAEALVSAFLNEALEQKIEQIEASVKDSIIASHLVDIKAQISHKKTFNGWFASVAENLTVNIVTILIIGALVIGSNGLGSLSDKAAAAVGLPDKSETRPAPQK